MINWVFSGTIKLIEIIHEINVWRSFEFCWIKSINTKRIWYGNAVDKMIELMYFVILYDETYLSWLNYSLIKWPIQSIVFKLKQSRDFSKKHQTTSTVHKTNSVSICAGFKAPLRKPPIKSVEYIINITIQIGEDEFECQPWWCIGRLMLLRRTRVHLFDAMTDHARYIEQIE